MKFYMLNLLFILTSFYASFIKVPVKKRTENKTIYLAMEIWLRWIIALWRQDSILLKQKLHGGKGSKPSVNRDVLTDCLSKIRAKVLNINFCLLRYIGDKMPVREVSQKVDFLEEISRFFH